MTLDIEPRFAPDLLMDICEFRPEEHGSFDWIHISPPCTEFSVALTSRPRQLELGDRLAEAALRLCEHYAEQGAVCTLENPASGLMKSEYMLPHAHRMRTIDYCKFRFVYRKRTAFWVWNLDNWNPQASVSSRLPLLGREETHAGGAARGLHEGRTAGRQPPQSEPIVQHPGRSGQGALRAHRGAAAFTGARGKCWRPRKWRTPSWDQLISRNGPLANLPPPPAGRRAHRSSARMEGQRPTSS